MELSKRPEKQRYPTRTPMGSPVVSSGIKKKPLPWSGEASTGAARSTGGGRVPPVIILQDGVDLLSMNGAIGIRHLFVLDALPTVRLDAILPHKDPTGTPSFFLSASSTL
jgi:hypothetical protein